MISIKFDQVRDHGIIAAFHHQITQIDRVGSHHVRIARHMNERFDFAKIQNNGCKIKCFTQN